MKNDIIKNNKRKIRDLLLSISATAILNIVIQFVLYPFLERNLGEERYGAALSVLSVIAIFAGTIGTSANYSRMVTSGNRDIEYTNGDYNLIVLSLSLVCGIGGMFYLRYLGISSVLSAVLFLLLALLTAFRYYSDVEFRMKSDFLRYMLYYTAISAGYLLGTLVYKFTGEWMLALITGEAFGIIFAFFASSIYRKNALRTSKSFSLVFKSMGFLMLSTLIENLTLNADRLLLMVFSGGVAVSVYYTASLVGKIIAMLSVPINSIIISYLVKYEGKLTKKLWSVASIAAAALGGIAFLGCYIVSPFILNILYPDLYVMAKVYVPAAILGQIFYFISGILLVILLRFCGEKKQFLFNLGYAVEFLAIVLIGTWQGGLDGFVYSSLIANAVRFLAVIIWGAFAAAKKPKASEQISEDTSERKN
ncbi:MAG: hypothetical protein IJ038_01995 [Clostridia bacterium]|nr:hypothetical protein [Clostridia bacterium]